jgi:sec-independent protein translocase protein TatA
MIFAKPWLDAIIVLLVVLLFFGPKRLPSLGRSLGEGMREFKDSITGHSSPDDEDADRPAVTEASAAPVAAAAPAPPAAPAASTAPAPPAPAEAPAPPVASSEPLS